MGLDWITEAAERRYGVVDWYQEVLNLYRSAQLRSQVLEEELRDAQATEEYWLARLRKLEHEEARRYVTASDGVTYGPFGE